MENWFEMRMMMKMRVLVKMTVLTTFPKRCRHGAKVETAGAGVTQPQSDRRLFRWVGKGMGWSREAFFPFPPHSQQRVPLIAGEGVPSINTRTARALRGTALESQF